MTAANDLAFRLALELTDVDFIDENGGGPGLRREGPVIAYVSTLVRIQSAFEKAGILFQDDNAAGGIGVRLKKPQRG